MALVGIMINLFITLVLLMVRVTVMIVVWMFRLMVLTVNMCFVGLNAVASRSHGSRH